MIEILSSTEAMVDSFADLKTVAEGTGVDYGAITTVYFGADITQTATPVTVPLTKTNFVIDGTYDGIRHTYTTTGDSSVNFVTTAVPDSTKPVLYVTMQHMNITGNNYYGAMGSADNSNYLNVVFTYSDVDYTGAQANFHRYGTVQYLDCRMSISRNEVAECGRVILGGETIINHTTALYSSFWMTLDTTSQSFRVLAGANISIQSPEHFIMLSSTGKAISLTGTTHLDIQGMQINYWGTANSAADPGGFTDIPTYSWRKTPLADQSAEDTYIRGNTVTSSFTADADITWEIRPT